MARSWAVFEKGINSAHRVRMCSAVESAVSEPPDEVTGPLAMWSLLYGVPFQYLVPSGAMLPVESIRFFQMDYDYLFAMLDGAMSLGRSFEIDYRHDAAIIDKVLEKVYSEAGKIRARLQRKPENVIMEAARDIASRGIGYGFLLRSEMVKGWRGLEFKAFDSNGMELRAAFLESIGTDILMGLYTGEIGRLEIAEPPEEMHFGCEAYGGGFRKKLRDMETGKLSDNTYTDVEMRDKENRIVDWVKTAGNIQAALALNEIHSAYIALEMIQNPATGEIVRS